MSAQPLQMPQVGRYQLRKLLGRGAQGAVYIGIDPTLDRNVAVKLLEAPSADSDTELPAFGIAEARAVARLQHPNIASIFDVGTHESLAYLVFELVSGRSLAERLKYDPRATPAASIHLITQILAGVAHAHAHGVAHLDLKPGNVVVADDGSAKVLDFGLSQMLGLGRSQLEAYGGTPGYMSPEHFTGTGLGLYSDVFALALMLYEMLVGESAVVERSWSGMRKELLQDGLDLSPLVGAGVDDALIAIISKALQVEPRERYPNAIEMAAAVAQATGEASAGATVSAEDEARAVEFVMRRLRSRGELPALSKAVMEVNRLTADGSDATVAQIANVVLRDQALTTRLLRLANSALYSTQMKASKVTDAISRIGFTQVRFIANALGYFDSMSGEEDSGGLREAVLKSFLAGLIARHLTQRLGLDQVEEGFLCGMLFDTGQHLVMHCLPEEHEAAMELLSKQDFGFDERARMQASRRILGADYARIGAVVAESWQLPGEIVAAIGARDEQVAELDDAVAQSLAKIAAMANEMALLATLALPDDSATQLVAIAARYHEFVALEEPEAVEILQAAAKKMERFAPALGVSAQSSICLRALFEWIDVEPAARANA